MNRSRLVSYLLLVLAVGCIVVGVAGAVNVWVALIVLGVLLGALELAVPNR